MIPIYNKLIQKSSNQFAITAVSLEPMVGLMNDVIFP